MTSMDQKLFPVLEKLFACVGIFLMTAAYLQVFLGVDEASNVDAVEGVQTLQRIYAALYLLTAILCIPHLPALARQLMDFRLLSVLIIWTALSVIWSIYPQVSLRRVVALVGTTLFGLYLARRFQPLELLRMVAWTMALAGAASIAMALLVPRLGVHPISGWHAGYWRGIYVHKNLLGQFMCLGLLAFANLLYCDKQKDWSLIGLLICGVAVIGAGSRTAWAVTTLCMFLPILIWFLRSNRSILIPGIVFLSILFISTVAAIWINLDEVLGMIGRDATLTGRSELWAVAWSSIWDHPWTGFGYRAFWIQQTGPAWIIWAIIGWQPATGHNSFLDIWIELGLVGLLLFLLAAGQHAWYVLRQVRQGNHLAYWYLTFLIFIFVISISQTVLLSQNSIHWVLFVAHACSIRARSGSRAVSPAYAETCEPSLSREIRC